VIRTFYCFGVYGANHPAMVSFSKEQTLQWQRGIRCRSLPREGFFLAWKKGSCFRYPGLR